MASTTISLLRTFSVLALISLILVKDPTHAYNICPSFCTCTPCDEHVNRNLIKATCHVNSTRLITSLPTSLCSLNLSESEIFKLPSRIFVKFKRLKELTLSYNKLQKIEKGSFSGLKALDELNLQHNSIKYWKVPFSKELPSLQHLDIRGNKQLRLSTKMLKKSKLQTIMGARASDQCGECNMERSNKTIKYIRKRNPCQGIRVLESMFVCQGVQNATCSLHFIVQEEKQLNVCYTAAGHLHPIEYILGVVAILLNALVLLTITLSKSLRQKSSFVLIANMSLGDALVGVYGMTVAGGHEVMLLQDIRLFRKFRSEKCPIIRSMLVLGEFIGVGISLLVCIERFLAIVYWKKPQLRLNLKSVWVAIITCWGIGIGVCLLIQYHNPRGISDNYMCLLVRDFSNTGEMVPAQGFMIVCVVLYFIIIVLYLLIYLFLRKTGNTSGIHRELALAKRIGVVVLTNGLFFVGPNMLVVCVTLFVASGELGSDPVLDFIVRKWVPPICMVLNACLDPLFYAYKNTLFFKAFKSNVNSLGQFLSRLTGKGGAVTPFVVQLSSESRHIGANKYQNMDQQDEQERLKSTAQTGL